MEKDISKKPTIKSRIIRLIWLIIFLTLLIGGLLMLIFCRQIFGNEIGDQILGKDVPNGFVALGNFFAANAYALLLTLITITLLFVVYFVIYFIITVTTRKTPRSRTIGSLLKSLIKYLAVVLGICLVLGIWGVNVAAIFASLGVVALIIGIGCKTLVNDIVSGFFIVVDNYFQVGDKVTIDGFTGNVVAIGLRTTKIRDWTGNLKCINNSLITSVVNLSRYNSYAEVCIDISFNEDLKRVEAIIIDNLPKIKERCPEILEGPFYKGVSELDECGVKLIFHAYVKEGDRISSQRKLLRELYLMCAENDIIIPFKQVVVNQPDPVNRKKATKQEIEASDKLMYSVEDNSSNKKKSFFESLNEDAEEF